MPDEVRPPSSLRSKNNSNKSIGYGKITSYIVPCGSVFRDRVSDLAQTRGASVADLARSVLLLLPVAEIEQIEDPGEPARDDREVVLLQSGPSAGRELRRKPRLQLRLPAGYSKPLLRRALKLALDMDDGRALLSVESQEDRRAKVESTQRERELDDENQFLKKIVEDLAFIPIRDGVSNQDEALHLLGFAPGLIPDSRNVKARYRRLAMVFHPDSPFGDHQRMSQLNEAFDILRHL
jgi:hypothetical protein